MTNSMSGKAEKMQRLMTLRLLEEFSGFLGDRNHNLDDILKYLTIHTFAPMECSGVFVSALGHDGTARAIGKFSISKELFLAYPQEISIEETNPLSEAIRQRQSIWSDGYPDWNGSASEHDSVENIAKIKTFICAPIEVNRSPIATLSIYCGRKSTPTEETLTFLRTINLLFTIFFCQINDEAKEVQRQTRIRSAARAAFDGKRLTRRQEEILQLMAAGKTNLAIAEILGFSESTIRQESIRIYAKLECSGRKEATLMLEEIKKRPRLDS